MELEIFTDLLEAITIFCFGLSWPLSIRKSYISRTAKGKSVAFELCIVVGYICGLAGKIIAGNITYVVIVYVLDLLMVSTDLILTLRNKVLDRMAEKKEAKAWRWTSGNSASCRPSLMTIS